MMFEGNRGKKWGATAPLDVVRPFLHDVECDI
jgi:hypothetical protein